MADQKLDHLINRLQANRTETLARMASHLDIEFSLEKIFQISCEEIALIFEVEIVCMAIYDEKSDSYHLVKIISSASSKYSIPEGLFSQSMFKNMNPNPEMPVFISDPGTLNSSADRIYEPDSNVPGLLAAGLFHRGRKLGIISILRWNRERSFSQEESALFQSYAKEIAIKIDHAYILLENQRQALRLMLMDKIIQSALTGSSLNELMDLLAGKCVEILAANGCYIMRWDNVRQIPVPYAAFGPECISFMNSGLTPDEITISATVIQSGHAIFIEDINESSFVNKPLEVRTTYRSILALPLKTLSQNLGVVLIRYLKPHPYFPKEDTGSWDEVASQISLAVASILSIEKEKQRRKEAELFQQATFAITSSLNLQEVLDHILTGLEQVVPFDSAAIFLIEGDYLKIVALGGSSRHTKRTGDKVAKFAGLFSIMESSNLPVILKDAQAYPEYEHWSEEGEDPIHGWMGVPLIAHDHPIGFLTLNCQDRDVYSADHALLARAFANQAVVAIDNARLFEKVRNGRERLQGLSRKLVNIQEAERRLIAHELHDKIGQDLTGLQFVLSIGKEGTESDRIRAFTEAQELVASLMSQVRELSLNLHPAMLDDLGLLPALKGHFERYQQQTGFQVDFDYENLDRRFPAEVELAAFRLVQESLTNVARHAAVKEVKVTLSADDVSLYARIEDQGQGFDMDILKDSERSFGVTGMRERTYQVGGKFEVSSKIGQGTRILAIFPIENKLERRGNDRQSVVSR